jgi:hypothetical protein
LHWRAPAQRARFVDIRDNIIDHIAEAERKRRLGEVDGQITLTGATDKLAQIDRRAPRIVDLPMPSAMVGPRSRLSVPGESVQL